MGESTLQVASSSLRGTGVACKAAYGRSIPRVGHGGLKHPRSSESREVPSLEGPVARGLPMRAYQFTVMVATVGLVPISEELKPLTSSYGKP